MISTDCLKMVKGNLKALRILASDDCLFQIRQRPGVMITKIKKYLDPSFMGDWKNIVCLSADDEDGNAHMSDAEGLAAILRDSVPFINVEKIYLDAYKEITSANGQIISGCK